MKKFRSSNIGLTLILSLILSGCTTMVHINSSVPKAEVILDGKPIGKTPLNVRLVNIAWSEYKVILIQEGYIPLKTELDKEIKILPTVFGVFFAVPLIWCYGPKPNQYFLLLPE